MILSQATVILKPYGFSDIIFASKTREANTTRRKPNITAKQYNSPKANITEKSTSAMQMCFFLEAPPGIEPGIEVLQTFALPLGHGAAILFLVYALFSVFVSISKIKNGFTAQKYNSTF